MSGPLRKNWYIAAIVFSALSYSVRATTAEQRQSRLTPDAAAVESAVLLISQDEQQLSWLTASSPHTVTLDEQPGAVALCSDGKRGYVATPHGVLLFDFLQRKRVAVIRVSAEPHALVLTADNHRLFALHSPAPNTDGSFVVSTIDTVTRKVVGQVQLNQLVASGMAATPDGAYLYVTHNYYAGRVSVIDTHRQRVSATIDLPDQCSDAAISPDGRYIYVNQVRAEDLALGIIDTATHQFSRTCKIGATQDGLAFQSDGQRLYVTTFDENTVVVFDTKRNEVISTIPVASYPIQCVAAPRGDRVYVRHNMDNRLATIDTATQANQFVDFEQSLIHIAGPPVQPTHESAKLRTASYAALRSGAQRCGVINVAGVVLSITLGAFSGRWLVRRRWSFGWTVLVSLATGIAWMVTLWWLVVITPEQRPFIYHADLPWYIDGSAPVAIVAGFLLAASSAAAVRIGLRSADLFEAEVVVNR